MLSDRVDNLLKKIEKKEAVSLTQSEVRLLAHYLEVAEITMDKHIHCGICLDNYELDGQDCDECCGHDFEDGFCLYCESEAPTPDYDRYDRD